MAMGHESFLGKQNWHSLKQLFGGIINTTKKEEES